MCKNNTVQIPENIKILDYDACALYPSAMYRSYYPAGKPYKMT